ncbi:MAG: ECF transporter S component [Candidatus Bathyarchaeia archaeon]
MNQLNSKTETLIHTTSVTWRTARIAVLTALSAAGSLLKIPSPVGSLAFDSTPGFFAALLFGPAEGAVVSGLGHLATAAVSGFPLGALHVPIAFGMALAGAAIGLLNKLSRRWGFFPALAIGVTVNTVLVFPLVPFLAEDISVGWIIAVSYTPFLLVAAALNAVVAGFAYVAVRGKLKL